MPSIHSKLMSVDASCVQYVHPWQENCTIAHAGLILQAAQYSLRTYSAVYLLSLAMRRRLPNWSDVRRTLTAIVQSTAFLTTNAFAYCMVLCIIRKSAGGFNFFTFSFVPAFLSSLAAILIERPSRRAMLALYTSNVATETIFNMAAVRGIVRPVRGGSCMLFGASAAALLYIYRLGDALAEADDEEEEDEEEKPVLGDASYVREENRKTAASTVKGDSIFDVLRYVVGKGEGPLGGTAGDGEQRAEREERPERGTSPGDRVGGSGGAAMPLTAVMQAVRAYGELVRRLREGPRHRTCRHRDSCAYYGLHGGARLFGIGLAIQVALKAVLQSKQVLARGPGHLYRVLAKWDTVKLGVFLGGFAGLYRSSSCALRHATGRDRPEHAVPAALVASCAFAAYPDTTVALYAGWKTLQLVYGVAEQRGLVPHVPHFDVFLYCASTAMLFHAGIMEPLTLRTSYWKFLHSLSGGRLAGMNREILDRYGYKTTEQLVEALRRTNTTHRIAFAL